MFWGYGAYDFTCQTGGGNLIPGSLLNKPDRSINKIGAVVLFLGFMTHNFNEPCRSNH